MDRHAAYRCVMLLHSWAWQKRSGTVRKLAATMLLLVGHQKGMWPVKQPRKVSVWVKLGIF